MNNSSIKSILITNLFLAARTGSELHTLELARSFKNAGWDVTCYTLIFAYPLQRDFEKAGIQVVTFGHEEELASHYDVFFAQHKLVSERLWSLGNFSFNKVVVSILGVATDQEALPYFYNQVDLFVYVSEEAKEHVAALLENEPDFSPAQLVMPNYATQDFFNVPQKTYPEQPKKLAVFSNHIPSEVLELEPLAKRQGVSIDFFGYKTRSVEVTPDLLSDYDVIISIGRTAQACFASQVPFYCYDHFGGPGYITATNLEESAIANFSGRSKPVKKSAEDLLQDILDNYQSSIQNLSYIKRYALDKFNYSKLFSALIKSIDDLPMKCRSTERDAIRNELSALRGKEYLQVLESFFGKAQIFYASIDEAKAEPTEKNSFYIVYRYESDIRISLDIVRRNGMGLRIIRFDPDSNPCACKFETQFECRIPGLHENVNDGSISIYEIDPQCIAINPIESISFIARPLNWNETINAHKNELARQRQDFEAQINQLQTKNSLLQEYINSLGLRGHMQAIVKLVKQRLKNLICPDRFN